MQTQSKTISYPQPVVQSLCLIRAKIIFNFRSGSAADTQAMTDIVKIQLEWLEIQQGEASKVHTAAHIFKGLGYEYRDQVNIRESRLFQFRPFAFYYKITIVLNCLSDLLNLLF